MNLVIFDNPVIWENLLPLSFTRPVCEVRTGAYTIREKWERRLEKNASWITQDYLQKKYPFKQETDNLFIAGHVLPRNQLVKAVRELAVGEALVKGNDIIAFHGAEFNPDNPNITNTREYTDEVETISHPWDVFLKAGNEMSMDIDLISFHSKHADESNTVLGNQLYLHPDAEVRASVINTETGPVIIDKNAEVMEGCMLRGPLYVGEHAVIKMGAKIYGATTLGPYSKVGGEVTNSVILGYSNKGHDGFLGNSVLGEWCNLGADTNTSNLKNNYSEVRVWSYRHWKFVETGLQFCGLIMGDHSKSGINTMFNTGTVVGVSANVFGGEFPPKIIPSFSWGGAAGLEEFKMQKAVEVASKMMERRNITFDDTEHAIFRTVLEKSWQYRS